MTLYERIKKTGKKAIVCASSVCILGLGSGCASTHKVTDISSVYGSIPPEAYSQEAEEVDYSKLTWQEAINHVKTPKQAQDYLYKHLDIDFRELMWGFNFLGINFFTKGETFKYNHTKRKGICIDYATAAAALLSDNGYPPLMLHMRCDSKRDMHVVFLYKTKEGFGALGMTPEKPVHKTIDSLVNALGEEYEYFSIVNLDDNYKNREWIAGDVDLQGHRIEKWEKVKK